MHEWVAELWATDRMERMRSVAARRALRRTLRSPRRPVRVALGMALIRVGRSLLPKTPEPRRAPRGRVVIADVSSPIGSDTALVQRDALPKHGEGEGLTVSADVARPILRVAFAGAFPVRFADRVRTDLDIACDVTVANEREIIAELPDVDVLVTSAFTAEMGAAAWRLKLVQVPAAGMDRIDRSALPAGTWLANAYGHETGIAEYVLGAILAWSRGFCRLDVSLRRGSWEGSWAAAAAPWPEVAGKTLGILGYGRIGQGVARRARAFDMPVWAIRRDPMGSAAHDLAFLGGPDALDEVLRVADYLVVALPLTEATRGLLGERQLRLMRSTAVLINVARAEIVDEAALYQALTQGTIAGAALDVWYRYPADGCPMLPARHAFHELPNVLMTPHVAGWTEGTVEARAKLIAENIRRVAHGERPLNLLPAVVPGP